jgi:hypothetical protein
MHKKETVRTVSVRFFEKTLDFASNLVKNDKKISKKLMILERKWGSDSEAWKYMYLITR